MIDVIIKTQINKINKYILKSEMVKSCTMYTQILK